MDLYVLLGVPREAGGDEIKRAFRRLARKYHPDINPGDRAAEMRFRVVADAYDVLIDPERRRQYDATGVAAPGVDVVATFGFEGFDFSVDAVQGREASTFGDLFADVIHDTVGSAMEGTAAGADLHVALSIGFEDAVRGTDRSITLVRRCTCRMCQGAGVIPVAETTCTGCRGAGTIRSARGHMLFAKACARCAGTGRLRHTVCAACTGAGIEARSETVHVAVPAGVADGERLRLAGLGHAGIRGGEPGDLSVTLQVAPHPFFRREGDELHIIVPVAVHEAALGTRFEIPTLDGPARLRVPPGTRSGQRFRLRERGVRSVRSGQRGDLVVEIRLVLPSLLDERSKELLREFGRINGEDVRADLWRDAPGS
ncbi:MAG: molecular chaperone DnaJ [Acidobacteriota bacterium]